MSRPLSLQNRLLGLLLSLVTVVWIVTAIATWFDTRHELHELLDGHLTQAAALLVAQQARELDEDETHVEAPSLHRYAPKVAFQVYHGDQQVAHSANAPITPLAGRHPGEKVEGFQTRDIDGVTWRVFSARGRERDIQVHVGEQIDSRSAILWALLRSTLWPMLLALPVLALSIWWAVKQAAAPLRELRLTLVHREPAELSPIALHRAPEEMMPMLDALNALFQRIQTLMDSERRFTADAAHELRTPIAAIRTQAQVALAEADDALRRHALLSTLEGCDRATRLVEQLLTLSRLETGATPILTRLDLSGLVQHVMADAAPQAIQKQQTIELDADQACVVAGDATLLSVLVRNLVDNAIRYSPSGAHVHVELKQDMGAPTLMIEDSGPGLSPEDLQRIGERFFRVMGTGESGSGLGWSIVQRIATVHHAQLQATRSPILGGLKITVRWPQATQSSSSS